MPVLDAVASRSPDGSRIYLKVVNTSATGALATSIDISGVQVEPKGEWHVLTAPTLEARNSFATPEAVRPRQEALTAGSSFAVTLPPHSVSVIVLQVARR